MKKILMITGDNSDDSEVLYPYYRVKEEGWEITVAAAQKATVHAKYHFTVEADIRFSEIHPEDFDGLILPGGMAPEKIRQDTKAVETVRIMVESGKPVCAICHGPQLLISAKVLKGRKATCYPGIADDLKNAGADYVNAPAVVDGNLVTSRRPQDLPDMMRAFIALFKSDKKSVKGDAIS